MTRPKVNIKVGREPAQAVTAHPCTKRILVALYTLSSSFSSFSICLLSKYFQESVLDRRMDRDALSPSQQEALSQLQALTNGGDADVAMSVLDSVGWDVQVGHCNRAIPWGFAISCMPAGSMRSDTDVFTSRGEIRISYTLGAVRGYNT